MQQDQKPSSVDSNVETRPLPYKIGATTRRLPNLQTPRVRLFGLVLILGGAFFTGLCVKYRSTLFTQDKVSSEVQAARDDLRKIRVKNSAGVLAGQLYSAGFDAEESELGEDRVSINVNGKVSAGKLGSMVCLPTYSAKDGTIDFRNTRRHLIENGIKTVLIVSKQDMAEVILKDDGECLNVTSHP